MHSTGNLWNTHAANAGSRRILQQAIDSRITNSVSAWRTRQTKEIVVAA